MNAKVPDFKPNYNEHPHLSFWLQALIFEYFGAQDWSARILGHIYYVLFMLLFFLSLRALVSETAAVIGTLILWIQPHFNAAFSSFLLDPGALFWGTLFLVCLSQALKTNRKRYGIFAGICLGLCAMTKGLTFLGFGPPALYLCILHVFAPQKVTQSKPRLHQAWGAIYQSTICIGALVGVISIYIWAVSKSSSPYFLEYYWNNQVTRRFSNLWSLKSFFLKEFWWPLLKDSLGFILLAPFAFFNRRHKLKSFGTPLVLFFSFVFLYAPAHRFGGHYLTMFLPSIAWLCGMALERFLKNCELLIIFSQSASVIAFAILQYIGLPIHGSSPSIPLKVLNNSIVDLGNSKAVALLDNRPGNPHFISASRLVWYGKTSVSYSYKQVSAPTKNLSHYLYSPSDGILVKQHISDISSKGWCIIHQQKDSILWRDCKTL